MRLLVRINLLNLSVFLMASAFSISAQVSQSESDRPLFNASRQTTVSHSTTIPSFGACEESICEPPFCAENCESPDKCYVKDIEGICYPSCGYLAVLAENRKYSGYGLDGQSNTSDDPRFLTSNTFCELEDKWGAIWKSIPTFNGRTAWEVVEGIGIECCGSSDQQVERNNYN